MSNRLLQVEDLLKREISNLIIHQVKDPRFANFNIVDVKASQDLSKAVVFFTIIGSNEDSAPQKDHIEKFESMIRSKVSKLLHLKRVPKLIFKFDNSLDRANSINNLINSINE